MIAAPLAADATQARIHFMPEPGKRDICMSFGQTSFDAITSEGFTFIDGQVADVVAGECDRGSGWIRFRFREPYRGRLCG